MGETLQHRLLVVLAVLSAVIATSSNAIAHEFWVAPTRYTVETGEPIVGNLFVGLMLRGTALPFLEEGFTSFVIHGPGGSRPVPGTTGDIPALSAPTREPGLHTVVYQSTANLVTYNDWDFFLETLAYEGLQQIAEVHRARDLPEKGFGERYLRHAKSLVRVGPQAAGGQDIARNLPLELVAQGNPYRPGLKTLDVRLLRDGVPVTERQVAILRYDGKVTRDLLTTDEDGVIRVAVESGGMFLLNAVDYRPVQDGDVVWESHWASLTFGLPIVLPPPHPLDPLSRQEIVRAIGAIGRSGHATASTRAALVTLAEPEKAEVLAWQQEAPVKRRAFALIRNDAQLFEAEVDLVAGKLERWTEMQGAQPPIQSAEWERAQRALKADPHWLAAMRLRGYDDVTQIFCDSLTVGFFDDPAQRSRRLIKMPCYDLAGTSTNVYGRPIEGVMATVDLNSAEVVEVVDQGVVPVSPQPHSFASSDDSPLLTTRDAAAEGKTFTRDRYLVSWRDWSFHVGFDQRFGAVVSLVRHRDEGEQRMVLYQGHVSEVFVPYMDADEGWYFRSYMDVGEYGLGALASPLQPGSDCPEDADYIDVDLVTPVGGTYVRERVLCLFERDTAAPLWRHWEALNRAYAGRPDGELVVRSIPSIGNYDYIVDWVFTRKGEIRIDVGATGIDAVKGVAVRHMEELGADEVTDTGMLVAPNLVAVHHDHYLSLRLDLDVDGPINSFARQRLTPTSLPADQPRRSFWRLRTEPAPTEIGLGTHTGPELWRVENPASKTALGHRRSYQIAAGHAATSLLSDDDWPQRRAGFSSKTLWVTAWHPGERFAAGPYPNQSPGGAGLPTYVDGEAIEATDVVAWYTLGFHHLTRPEDWPVLPTVWHSVRLRPYGFFDRNPDVQSPAN